MLHSFTLNFVAHQNILPDIAEFLKHHGLQLTLLDLNTIPALDLAGILAACPMLTSFSFNPDRRLPLHTDQNDNVPATLLHEPHSRMTHLGLHQLLHAFLSPSHSTGNNSFRGGGLPQAATMLLQCTYFNGRRACAHSRRNLETRRTRRNVTPGF